MRQPIQDVVRAVAETLIEQVLPDLDPATWTASRIRACAVLLASVEDRLVLEIPLLLETNGLMRRLISDVVEGVLPLALDPVLAADLEGLLARYATPPGIAAAARLGEENEAYKTALETLSRHAAAARRLPGAADDRLFRERLHETLRILQASEVTLAQRANRSIPL